MQALLHLLEYMVHGILGHSVINSLLYMSCFAVELGLVCRRVVERLRSCVGVELGVEGLLHSHEQGRRLLSEDAAPVTDSGEASQMWCHC